MKKYSLYQVDSFTKDKFFGNPAGVVPNADGLTDEQMQQIAREMNNSETAFILSPDGSDHEVRVRFFTPTTEVPSCGHATIAAHYVRAVEKELTNSTVVQKIGVGILPVEIKKQDNDYKIIMTQGAIEFSDPLSSEVEMDILKACGLFSAERDIRCPIQIVSTGHSKVLIGMKSRQVLNSLKPDLTRLAEISQSIECNGYFVFTFDSDDEAVLTHGRMFAPAIGIAEDPVTGNANGPLGAYIVKHGLVPIRAETFSFSGMQGEAIGRLGIVDVDVLVKDGKPQCVKVGGQAVIVFKTEMEI
ncbi:PhzF family isomerase [candidate division KSB1 bacterium]|nr:PhzF family isomerase [candidate division KSB1 bacterium]